MVLPSTLVGLGRFAEACQRRATAVEINPRDGEADLDWGIALTRASKPAEKENATSSKRTIRVGCLLATIVLGLSQASAATKAEPATPLTAAGEKLLADDDLMKQMLLADGARAGRYGKAMQIYTSIQKASERAGKGILQRLALGTSLEQAPLGW